MLRQAGAGAACARLLAQRSVAPGMARAIVPSFPSSSRLPGPSSVSSVYFRQYASEAAQAAQVQEEPDAVVADASEDEARRFASLEGRLNHYIVDALTGAPFNYDKMSEVQYQVTNHLEEIVAPVQGTAPLPGSKGANDEEAVVQQGPTDLLVKAKTGTGKTLAFLMPAIEARLRNVEAVKKGTAMTPAFRRLLTKNQPDFDFSALSQSQRKSFAHKTYTRNSVGALIISPTRELAVQISNEAKKLGQEMGMDFNVHTLMGGQEKRQQLRAWSSRSLDVVVATPGRLEALLQESPTVRSALSATETLIFDEADTLLEMGFRDSINNIVEYLPPKKERRTLLFSATVPVEIRQVAQELLSSRRRFIDCVPEGESNVHAHIGQTAYIVKPEEQFTSMMRLLAHDQVVHGEKSRVIVFCPTAKMTQLASILIKQQDFLAEFPLNVFPSEEDESASMNGRRGDRGDRGRDRYGNRRPVDRPRVEIHEMHSRLTQQQRDRVAQRFRNSRAASVLVTSDLSARGVDYPDVTRVIQVDLPRNKDQYVHRIGRTGRAGKAGRADMIILEGWQDSWPEIEGRDLPVKAVRKGGEAIRQELVEAWDQRVAEKGWKAGEASSPAERVGKEIALPASQSRFCASAESGESLEQSVLTYMTNETNFEHVRFDTSKDGQGGGSRDHETGRGSRVGKGDEDVPLFGADGSSGQNPSEGSPLRHVWMASMGYWIGLVGSLRIQKADLYRGAQAWGRAALGLSDRDSSLSRSMASKMGISLDQMGGGWGGRRLGAGDSSRGGRSGRGDYGGRSGAYAGRRGYPGDKRDEMYGSHTGRDRYDGGKQPWTERMDGKRSARSRGQLDNGRWA